MELVRHFSGLTKTDSPIAGGKGASLGEMTTAGIPVPPGFVVLSGAFEQFIKETDLTQEIDAVLHTVNHKDIATVERASEKIRALILDQEMPEDIKKEIDSQFKKLGTDRADIYAIFSSIQSFNTEKKWFPIFWEAYRKNKHIRLSKHTPNVIEGSVALGQTVLPNGTILRPFSGSGIQIFGGIIHGISIAKNPNVPIVLSSHLSDEEIKKNLNPNNPYLSITRTAGKLEFLLDDTGWDTLELLEIAYLGISDMVSKLYQKL